MSKLTNLTVKGQVTIPKDVRDALGLRPNEPVEIGYDGGEVATIRKPRPASVDDLVVARRRAEALDRLDRLTERFRHLRTGVDTDAYMAELREPLPTPDPGRP